MIPTSEEFLAINIIDLNVVLPVGAIDDGVISIMAVSVGRQTSVAETDMKVFFGGGVQTDMEMSAFSPSLVR